MAPFLQLRWPQHALRKAVAAMFVTTALAIAARSLDPTIPLEGGVVILDDVGDPALVTNVKEFLAKRFDVAVQVRRNPVDLASAWRPGVGKWDHGTMMQDVELRLRWPGRALLLTDRDTYGSGRSNWSSGISMPNGVTSVVSIFRLRPQFWGDPDDRTVLERRVRKIVLHELGHTFGKIEHCDDWSCVIHRSDSIADIDRTGDDYCARCNALAVASLARWRNSRDPSAR